MGFASLASDPCCGRWTFSVALVLQFPANYPTLQNVLLADANKRQYRENARINLAQCHRQKSIAVVKNQYAVYVQIRAEENEK